MLLLSMLGKLQSISIGSTRRINDISRNFISDPNVRTRTRSLTMKASPVALMTTYNPEVATYFFVAVYE